MKSFFITGALRNRQRGYPQKSHVRDPQLLKLFPLSKHELIRELKSSSENLKLVLQTPNMMSRLSIKELMIVIAPHPEIVAEICKNKKLMKSLEKRGYKETMDEELRTLRIVQNFSRNPRRLITQLYMRTLDEIAEYHPSIVMQIFDMPELVEKLDGYTLARLAVRSLKFAHFILDTPQLIDKLLSTGYGIDNFPILGWRLPEIAQRIFNTPELINKFGQYHLATLGCHPEIGYQILNTPQLLEKLDDICLAEMGQSSPEIANRILDITALFNRLNAKSLAILGQGNPRIVDRILNTPELVNLLLMGGEDSLSILGSYCPEIRLRIMKTPELSNLLPKKIDDDLHFKGHPSIGKVLLEMNERNEISMSQDLKNNIEMDIEIWDMLTNTFNPSIETITNHDDYYSSEDEYNENDKKRDGTEIENPQAQKRRKIGFS